MVGIKGWLIWCCLYFKSPFIVSFFDNICSNLLDQRKSGIVPVIPCKSMGEHHNKRQDKYVNLASFTK